MHSSTPTNTQTPHTQELAWPRIIQTGTHPHFKVTNINSIMFKLYQVLCNISNKQKTFSPDPSWGSLCKIIRLKHQPSLLPSSDQTSCSDRRSSWLTDGTIHG